MDSLVTMKTERDNLGSATDDPISGTVQISLLSFSLSLGKFQRNVASPSACSLFSNLCLFLPLSFSDYELDDRCLIPGRARDFPLHSTIRPVLGSTQFYPTDTGEGGVLFLGLKQPEREAEHSPTSGAKVKNE
jgi:hypothetical protein